MLTFIGRLIYYYEKLRAMAFQKFLQQYYYKRAGKIGKGVRFNGVTKITGLDKLEIGDNVHIGDGAFIRAEGGLKIGDNTHFARYVTIYTHSHNYEGEVLPYDDTFRYREVVIERNAWIGINVTILPGAYIGEGAIIGAGAVVAGRVEKFAICGAPLAQKIKERNEEHYNEKDSNKLYGGISGRPLK